MVYFYNSCESIIYMHRKIWNAFSWKLLLSCNLPWDAFYLHEHNIIIVFRIQGTVFSTLHFFATYALAIKLECYITLGWGHIFSHERPFFERAVSSLDP